MKNLVIVFVLFGAFAACNEHPERHPFQGKEFEGMITYRVTYTNFPDEAKSGDTFLVFYKKGNLLKLRNVYRRRTAWKEVLLLDGNRYYFMFGRNDTVYSMNINDHLLMKLDRNHHSVSDTRILGYNCEQIDMEVNHWRVKNFHVHIEMLYSKDALRMNPDYFKDRKILFFNQYMDEAGSYFLKMVYEQQFAGRTGLSRITYTAIKINETKIDPKCFDIDTSLTKPYLSD